MSDVLLPLMLPRMFAYPGNDEDEPQEIPYVGLDRILTEPADDDAHFCAYSLPELPYRLKKEVLETHAVPMVLAIFDVDDPVAHEQGIEARQEWWNAEGPKIEALHRAHPGAFIYGTRGGYRIVGGILPEVFYLRTLEDAETWKAFYLTWCRYLCRSFKIDADAHCKDWTRLYRIPKATRDGKLQEGWTLGDAAEVGIWDPDLSEEDLVEPEPVRAFEERPTRTDPPLATRIALAKEALAKLPPSIQGKGGDAALFNACRTVLVGYDLPAQAAAELIASDFDPRCKPPWGGDLQERLDHNLGRLEEGGTGWGDLLDGAKLRDTVAALVKPKVPPPDPSKWKRTLDYAASIGSSDPPWSTGLETLDKVTRGGLRARNVAVLGGAPGAGKTTLAVQLAYHYAKQGIPVAIIAADEDVHGLLMRIGQAGGIDRDGLEAGKEEARAALRELILAAPFDIFDAEEEGVTVESVSKILAERGPGVLVVDSLQTVKTDTSTQTESKREEIDDVVKTCKQVAKLYGHAVIATSELARGAYRSKKQADNIEDLAAFKESGGIEYGAKYLLVLRTPPKDAKIVDVTVPKARGGRKIPFRLELNFATATFKEVPIPEEGPEEMVQGEPPAARNMRIKSIIWRAVRANPDTFFSTNGIGQHLKDNNQGCQNGLVSLLVKELIVEGKIQKIGQYFNCSQEPV